MGLTGAPPLALQVAQRVQMACHVEIKYTDATQVTSIPVKRGTFIDPVRLVKLTDFDGSPALKVGISYNNTNNALDNALVDDDDALLNDTSAALGTQSDPTTSDGGGAEPIVAANSEVGLNGWLMESDGYITITLTAGTSPTKGRAILKIAFSCAATDGITFADAE